MMIDDTYILYALLSANALFIAIVCVALFRFALRLAALETLLAQPAVPLESAADSESTLRSEQTLQRLDARVAELQRGLQALGKSRSEQRDSTWRQPPIENAVRMAQQGASVDDLTRNCGLNIGEARLMQKLHGQVRVAAARS